MYQGLSKILVIMTASFALLACATGTMFEQKLMGEGAKRMNAEQVTAHLAGKTQKWINGGAYFFQDGTVFIKYAGKVYPKRTWAVDGNGKACILLPDGFVTSCSAYFDKDGEVWVVNLEIMGEAQQTDGGPDTVLEGNQLSEI
jgi:hypothetical protein